MICTCKICGGVHTVGKCPDVILGKGMKVGDKVKIVDDQFSEEENDASKNGVGSEGVIEFISKPDDINPYASVRCEKPYGARTRCYYLSDLIRIGD